MTGLHLIISEGPCSLTVLFLCGHFIFHTWRWYLFYDGGHITASTEFFCNTLLYLKVLTMCSFSKHFLNADLGYRPSHRDTAVKTGRLSTFPHGICCTVGCVLNETKLKAGIFKACRKGLRWASVEGRWLFRKSAGVLRGPGLGCPFLLAPTFSDSVLVAGCQPCWWECLYWRLENTPHQGFKT